MTVALVVAGCGYQPDPDACALDDGIFPGERLNDWKGYADHVALVRVGSARLEDGRAVLALEALETYFSGLDAPEDEFGRLLREARVERAVRPYQDLRPHERARRVSSLRARSRG